MTYNNKSVSFTIAFFFCCFWLFSQQISPQIISTSGSSFSSGSVQLDYTLGELVIATFTNTSSIYTQGFHQPEMIITEVSTNEAIREIKIFPNPTESSVQVQLPNKNIEFIISIYSSDGKLLISSKTRESNEVMLNISNFAQGTYLLKVAQNDSVFSSFVIIKK